LIPAALRELGYVEGQNLIVERRYAEGKLDRFPGLARELVRLRVDVIVAITPGAIRAAKDATKTIPIVLYGNFDPVAAGFVESLARPGGNITGVLIAPGGHVGRQEAGASQGGGPADHTDRPARPPWIPTFRVR
jgi:putative ABC transport system substrate-binding protein